MLKMEEKRMFVSRLVFLYIWIPETGKSRSILTVKEIDVLIAYLTNARIQVADAVLCLMFERLLSISNPVQN